MSDPKTRSIDQRGTEAESRATNDRSTELLPLQQTDTSMATDAPPIDQRPQPKPKFSTIVRKIDVFHLAGSTLFPDEEVGAASSIWSQCGIQLVITSRKFYDDAETRKLLQASPEDAKKAIGELIVIVDPDDTTPSVKRLRAEWSMNKRGDYAAFFAPNVRLTTNGAPSCADPVEKIVYIGKYDAWPGWVLAHELGHHWISRGHYGLESPLMHPNSPGNKITDLECRAARGDARALFEIQQRQNK